MRRGHSESRPLCGGISLFVAPGAEADDFKVNTGADVALNGCTKNDCSVREAIIAANKNKGKDTVILQI